MFKIYFYIYIGTLAYTRIPPINNHSIKNAQNKLVYPYTLSNTIQAKHSSSDLQSVQNIFLMHLNLKMPQALLN